MDLTPSEKLAWFYIKDHCDNVGVWTPNFRLAEFVIGFQLDWEKFADKCNGNIAILENGKWWLVDYCSFQHKDLVANPEGGSSNAVKSYVRDLKDHGLYEAFLNSLNNDAHAMPIECPSDGPRVRVRVRERVKEEEETRWNTDLPSINLTESEHKKLVDKYPPQLVEQVLVELAEYQVEKGKVYKSSYLTTNKWCQRKLDEWKKKHGGPSHRQVAPVETQ